MKISVCSVISVVNTEAKLPKNPLLSISHVARNSNCDYNTACQSGRGAARLARLHGVQEVGGSNPLAPTRDRLQTCIMDVSGLCFSGFGTFSEPETSNIVLPFMWPPK